MIGGDQVTILVSDWSSQKIADRIAENVATAGGGGAVIVTLDSKKLSLNIDNHALLVQQHDTNSGKGSCCYNIGIHDYIIYWINPSSYSANYIFDI